MFFLCVHWDEGITSSVKQTESGAVITLSDPDVNAGEVFTITVTSTQTVVRKCRLIRALARSSSPRSKPIRVCRGGVLFDENGTSTAVSF